MFALACVYFVFIQTTFCQENSFSRISKYPNLSIQDSKIKYALLEVPTYKETNFDISLNINLNDQTIKPTEKPIQPFLQIPEHNQFLYLPLYKKITVQYLQKSTLIVPAR